MSEQFSNEARGGKMEIPDGYFINKVDLDADNPYCIAEPTDLTKSDSRFIHIPMSLAHYMRTHFCGSKKYQNNIENYARRELQNKIKSLLNIK